MKMSDEIAIDGAKIIAISIKCAMVMNKKRQTFSIFDLASERKKLRPWKCFESRGFSTICFFTPSS